MSLTDLRCEYAANPLGIDVIRPRFFWRLETQRAGARQTAYRLKVASQSEQLETPDLWDSGVVESGQTTQIEYAGQELNSRQRAYWQVESRDEEGQWSTSEVAHWEMGLLSPDDWQAKWIGGDLVGGSQQTIPAPYLRRELEVASPVKSARLYATALGFYECEINGQKVGDQFLTPGWTDYNQRVRYQTYDVTALLQNGPNVWGAILGDGWYCGSVDWRARQQYGDAPRFLAQLEIELENGERLLVVTDEQWQYAYGPMLANDMQLGESYDARLALGNWSQIDFVPNKKWHQVEVFDVQNLKITAQDSPLVRVTQEIASVGQPQHLNGQYIFDMGQNMVGTVRLKVHGPRGTTIRLRFAETLVGGPKATSGPIYTENLRGPLQVDYYTLSGDPAGEIWEPKFTFHGFRFVEVSHLPHEPTADTLTGLVMHSDLTRTGDFDCSNPLLGQLQRNIDWGWRGNSLDVPTDCPQRNERLGWTGDAQVFVRTAAFNRDVAAFFAEWARNVADAQQPTGGIPATVPNSEMLQGEGSADGGPAWADAVLICPWTIYQCYGDKRILEENYEVFTRYLDFMQRTSKDGLRCYDGCGYFGGFGDWLALDGSGKTEGGTPTELLGTAFFAHAADLMSQIAATLSKTEDAQRYAELFQKVRRVFSERYVTAEGFLSPPYQTPYVLALEFNLVSDELRPKVARQLVQAIKDRGGLLSTGFVGTVYLNHVLTATGNNEAAFKLLLQERWPSWLYAVTQGATTIWERWNGWTQEKGFEDAGMNSFNHYAYGAIGDWLYQMVAGIQLDPQEVGYKKFILHPTPGGGLTWAKAHLDTLHGRIESSWELEEGQFNYQYVVPPNTSATLILPDGSRQQLEAGAGQVSITF